MKKIEWNKLTDDDYRELYRRWMCNPDNSMRCDECPYFKDGFYSRPCGQQKCWVDATCKNLEDF